MFGQLVQGGIAVHAQEAHGHRDSEPKAADARCLVWDCCHLVRAALTCLALPLMLHLLRVGSPCKCSTGALDSPRHGLQQDLLRSTCARAGHVGQIPVPVAGRCLTSGYRHQQPERCVCAMAQMHRTLRLSMDSIPLLVSLWTPDLLAGQFNQMPVAADGEVELLALMLTACVIRCTHGESGQFCATAIDIITAVVYVMCLAAGHTLCFEVQAVPSPARPWLSLPLFLGYCPVAVLQMTVRILASAS